MTLSIQDLLSLQNMPTEEEITLQLLASFYEEHVCHYVYHYRVRHKEQNIRLHFKTSDLPHLLGIQKVIPTSK